MRIAFFSDFFLPQMNGIIDSMIMHASALVKRGHTVRIFTLRASREPLPPLPFEVTQYPSIGVPGAWDWRLAFPFGITKDCLAFQPDILHSENPGPIGFAAPKLARKLQRPLIGRSHTFPADYLHYLKLNYGWARRWLERSTANYFNRCTLVAAPSEAMLRELRSYGLHAPTACVSNIVETSIFRPQLDRDALRASFGLTRYTLLSAGRLVLEKNLGDTLHGFRALRDAGVDATLVMVGDGPERANLERQAEALGIRDNMLFTGSVSHQVEAQWMSASDVYVITSKIENQSMTTLQAMACGKPVIAVRGGGSPEYVREGETGFVIEAGDAAAFARAAQSLQEPSLRQRMSEHALHHIESTSSPQAVGRRWEGIYTDLLSAKPA